MSKKYRLILLCLILAIGICFAGTHDPWTGVGWDVASPDIDQPHGNAYKEIYDLRKGVAVRINKEHVNLATSSAGGEHMQGSAVAWHLATGSIPALQPDGTALASTDNGRLWHDITTDIFYVLDDYSDPTVDGGWIEMGSYLGGITINTNKFTVARATGNTAVAGTLTITGESTFNNHVNLGAGDDLIGSSTSDITMNTNKFTVAGATGNTVVAGTLTVTGESTFNNHVNLGAGDDLIGSSTSDITMNTNKFTVAGATGNTAVGGTLAVTGASTFTGGIFGSWTDKDSGGSDALARNEIYKVGSDGFLIGYQTGGNGALDVLTDSSSTPSTTVWNTSGGTGTQQGCCVPVKKDHYWQVTNVDASITIYWLPIGAGTCVKQ